MSADRNRGIEQQWNIPPQTEDPRFNLDEDHPGLIPGQASPEGRQEGHVIEHDSDTYELTNPFEEDRQLAEQALDQRPTPADNDEGFWTKRRKAIAAGVAGLAITAGTIVGIASKDSGASTPEAQSTSTEAPASPGQTETSKESGFEKLTIENFPYRVNGEVYTGYESLKKELIIDGQETNPEKIAGQIIEISNVLANLNMSDSEKGAYKGYVGSDGESKDAEGISKDFIAPIIPEFLGTNFDEAMKPDDLAAQRQPRDFVRSPEELYQAIIQANIGNSFERSAGNGFTLQSGEYKNGLYDHYILPTPDIEGAPKGNVNSWEFVLTVGLEAEGLPPMPVTWHFAVLRLPLDSNLPVGPDNPAVWKIANFSQEVPS